MAKVNKNRYEIPYETGNQKSITRRDFLKATAAGTVSVATMGVLGACTTTAAAPSNTLASSSSAHAPAPEPVADASGAVVETSKTIGTPGPVGAATPVSPFKAVDDFVPPEPAVVEDDTRATPIEENLALFPVPSGMLDGQVAIVTGASSGFGREIARAYAREGAKVVAVARRTERLVALAEESAAYPGEIAAFTCDVTDRGQLKQMIDFTIETYGRIDILVNNAGGIGCLGRVEYISEGQWDYFVELNLTAPVMAMKYAIPYMVENGYGRIINMSSVAGIKGGVGGIEYTATKHGLIGASKNVAFMYADKGITANTICPGGFDTEVNSSIVNADPEGMAGETLGAIGYGAVRRQGKTEEIAAMAVWLASPAAIGLNSDSVLANGGGWGSA